MVHFSLSWRFRLVQLESTGQILPALVYGMVHRFLCSIKADICPDSSGCNGATSTARKAHSFSMQLKLSICDVVRYHHRPIAKGVRPTPFDKKVG